MPACADLLNETKDGLAKTVSTFKIDGYKFEVDELIDMRRFDGKEYHYLFNLFCDHTLIAQNITQIKEARRIARQWVKELKEQEE
jgi:hypothetical protein